MKNKKWLSALVGLVLVLALGFTVVACESDTTGGDDGGLPLPYGHDRLVRRYGVGRNGFFLRRVFFLHRLRRGCLRC